MVIQLCRNASLEENSATLAGQIRGDHGKLFLRQFRGSAAAQLLERAGDSVVYNLIIHIRRKDQPQSTSQILHRKTSIAISVVQPEEEPHLVVNRCSFAENRQSCDSSAEVDCLGRFQAQD
eukprot:TRINITY_DN25630_c0_g1_i1.p3 TRINITY_DN25630_c0_g1~~TRINITY_DN25630_c0_g1_i1.p3  ORF type:complete len:121 (-),score=14.20 TRINITY_DN25630_c0_g1_i1:170-532(-)